MKPLFLLPLLLTAVLSENKVNLDDIEKDNLHAETRVGKKLPVETLRTEESKYSTKTEGTPSQQQHQLQQVYQGPTTATQELGNQVGDYAELQSYESFKYAQPQSQDYSEEKYPDNGDSNAYQQASSLLTNPAEQQHYYIQEGRSNSQNAYEALQRHRQQQYRQQTQQHQQTQQQQQQQQLYQQEVLVGNQLQSEQQKAAAQKYVDTNEDRGTYYVNIPMSQLLAYYQNYGIVQPKHKNAEQQHHQQHQQQVSTPVYMPVLTQNQAYTPTKVTYQPEVEYVPSYPTHTQTVFAKSAKSGSSIQATPAATASSPVHQLPAASHQQYTVPLEMLANSGAGYQAQKYQYYVDQQQAQALPQQQHQYAQQQQQQYVYTDIYNSPETAYVQDNSLYEQQHQQQQQHHQQQNYYVPAALAEQLMAQILNQAGIHNGVSQQVIKQEPQEPLQHDFAPPQYQAQKFRPSQEVTHLVPVSNENEGYSAKSIYSSTSASSQPKTLLDSYIPSHIIAAQDANRYRERPIKLESGFLPSKINFIRSYKKRKTD